MTTTTSRWWSLRLMTWCLCTSGRTVFQWQDRENHLLVCLTRPQAYASGRDGLSPKAQHLETNRDVESTQVSFTACADRRKDIDALDSILSWLREREKKINSRFWCSVIVCIVNIVENRWHWFHCRWKKAMHLMCMTCQHFFSFFFFFKNTFFVSSTYSCQESRILTVRNPRSPNTHL